MLNGERIRMKGSIYESFTSTQQKDIIKMKQDNKIKKDYALMVYKDGNYEEITQEELDELKKECPLVAQLLENPNMVDILKDPDVPEENTPLYDHWEKVAKRLLASLWRINSAQIFHNPVDPDRLGIPDYFEVVKDPIDFGTIKQRLNYSMYMYMGEVVEDIQRCFDNCVLYNGEDSPAGARCMTVNAEFRKLYTQLNIDFYMIEIPKETTVEEIVKTQEESRLELIEAQL